MQWAMNFQGKPKWIATVVEKQLGPLTFVVRLKDGRTWKRHQDHLRRDDQMRMTSSERNKSCPMRRCHRLQMVKRSRQPVMTYSNPDTVSTVPTLEREQTPVSVSTAPNAVASPMAVRRSTRVIKPPDKLNL